MTGFYRDQLKMKLNYLTGRSAIFPIAGYLMSWVCNCDPHLHICFPSNIQ